MTDCSPHSTSDEGPADEILRELLPEFFTAWVRDLCNAQSVIIAQEDATSLHRLGHTIKGSMIQFGFRSLATIGIEIMRDAEQGDFTSAAARITLLQQKLNHLQQHVS